VRFARITHDPAVMGGKPCIRRLRVTVATILGLLATGESRERILQAYPYLEPQDIDEALAYAAWRLQETEASNGQVHPRNEWERRLLGIATDCGVSLPNSALSSEGLYD
jgi:uncharacterized protein (DUF433 family)